jgi:hypothetical protein
VEDGQVVAANTHAYCRVCSNRSTVLQSRCCAPLNRTITNTNSATAAREARTAAGFAVLGMTMPRQELLAQSSGAPVESAGPIWRVIAGELASRAELAEVTR